MSDKHVHKWTEKEINELKKNYAYYINNKNKAEIIFGKSWKAIEIKASREGVSTVKKPRTTTSKISKQELEHMYIDKKMSAFDIGVEYNVNYTTIISLLTQHKIKIRSMSEIKLNGKQKISKKCLNELYINKKMSSLKIAEKFDIHKGTVVKWMHEYGIELRSHSESMSNKSGESSCNWRGGISFEPYCEKFNNEFKEAVRKRDDYTCQLCGYEQKLNNEKLSVHHIHYDKSNCWPDVVALCRSCNSRVNGNRDYWEKYFENLLINHGHFCWSVLNT